MMLFVLAFLSFFCAREPKRTDKDQQMPPSLSEINQEKPFQQQIITIHLPGLPEDAKKLEMILIKPGSFTMGSSRDEQGRSDTDWPLHDVTITKPFYMGKYEVTQAQWESVMGNNPSYFRGKPNNPVEKVRWRTCQRFIKKLNSLGQGTFRLPTEAEWEYACRVGTMTRFSFGDSLEKAYRYMWWERNNETNGTKEVGLKMPNLWGLYDMHGNVQEWCEDRWELPNERGPQTDPKGTSSRSSFFFLWTNRVIRGGSFGSRTQDCRSSYRSREQSIDFHYSLGFRLVRE
ncbi:MAG: formylglycine-generating enzyme family protein [Candidatus Aminicenantes bacterium]|nr:MAG: formylglycine-generating enzyme family protein [Candidatus Aminicenantes bacterium]